jgi:tape measure domain-containing protein
MAQNIIFRVVADTQPAVDGMNKLGNATNNTKKDVSQLDQALGKIGTMVAGAFAIDKIVEFGKAVLKATAEMQNLEVRMKDLAGSNDEAVKTFGDLKQMANDLGLSYKSLTTNYIQFTSAAKASGMEVDKASRIFKSMTIALAGTGASSEQTKNAMTALTQMIGKQKISAEELRQQLGEAMPSAFGIMAKALGVTTKELDKMMASGQLLANEVLPKFAEEAERAFGGNTEKMAGNIQANLNRLQNAWEGYMTSLGERFYGSGGGAEVLADMLTWWTNINQTQEQYIQNERMRLLADYKQQDQVKEQIANLEKEKKSEEEIIHVLEAKIKEQEKIARGYENIGGYQFLTGVELTAEEKVETLKLISAMKQKVQLMKDEIKERNKPKPLTKEEIKEAEKARKAREKELAEKKKLEDQEFEDNQKRREGEFKVDRETQEAYDKFQIEQQKDKQREAEELAKKGAKQLEIDKEAERVINQYFYNEDLALLDEKHKQGLSSEEDYLQALLELRKKYGMDVGDVEKNITISDVDKKKIQKQQITKLAGETAEGVTNTILAYKQREIDGERDMVEKQRQAGLISEEQYDQQMRAIKRKQAIADRIAAIAQIAINTAIALTNPTNIASFGAISPFIIASGAIQAGIVLAQPLPYNKGTKRVPMMRGAVRGRDSVHAILTPDERVVPADINMQPGYSALLDLAQDKKISDKEAGFLAELATSGMRRTGTQQSIDPDIIGKAIAKHIPHTNVAINDRGIAVITERSQTEIRRLRRRIG